MEVSLIGRLSKTTASGAGCGAVVARLQEDPVLDPNAGRVWRLTMATCAGKRIPTRLFRVVVINCMCLGASAKNGSAKKNDRPWRAILLTTGTPRFIALEASRTCAVLYRIDDRTRLRRFAPGGAISEIALSADEKQLLIAADEGASLWDV